MIISNCEAIEQIHWQKIGAKAVKAEAVAIVDGHMVVRLTNGRFAVSGAVDPTKWAYGLCKWSWIGPVLNALVSLKAITPEDREKHLALVGKRDAERERKLALERLDGLTKQLGLKLTPEQRRALKTNAALTAATA